MPFFERILSKSESPDHLHGKSTTMADIALLEGLLCLDEELPGAFDNFPKVKVNREAKAYAVVRTLAVTAPYRPSITP
jgi:hypothetical protein